jgi:uncharacterized protein DUF3500
MCDSKRRTLLRSSAALLGGAFLTGKRGSGFESRSVDPPDGLHGSVHATNVMTETATRLLAALTPEQLAQARIEFSDDERRNWHYVPLERKGLQLRHMTPYQRHLASALLAAGLSQSGFIKAVTIMSLEDVLKVMENDSGERRNPEKYYFSIFGEPSATGTWGYRVEGHHISQNYTVINGEAIGAPSFFVSNPAEVRIGPRKGLRVLAAEDTLGFALIESLDERQRNVAIVDQTAYADILTSDKRVAALEGQPSGLPSAQMNSNQYDALRALVEVYARNLPDELARRRMEQLDKAARNIHFAWAGGTKPGDPHYYRVQTPLFLIELDNTQDKANHIHSVWRDTRDFGGDLLRAHYEADHHARHA